MQGHLSRVWVDCVQVERELLEQYESELLEKEHSGCAALMRNDKVRAPACPPALPLPPLAEVGRCRGIVCAELSGQPASSISPPL